MKLNWNLNYANPCRLIDLNLTGLEKVGPPSTFNSTFPATLRWQISQQSRTKVLSEFKGICQKPSTHRSITVILLLEIFWPILQQKMTTTQTIKRQKQQQQQKKKRFGRLLFHRNQCDQFFLPNVYYKSCIKMISLKK